MVPEHSQGASRGFSAVGWWSMRGGRDDSCKLELESEACWDED